ncbi:MAG: acyl-CoA thioesterase [Akkermansia sp.]|nr:acyl-CoA thioesterase [Akkermansia sp.]
MPAFTYSRRIAFHETDAAGIVYFANYFHLAEEAETHALASLSTADTFRRYAYPRVHVEADYHAPLRFFEMATVQARLTRIGGSSLHWEFRISGPARLCATLTAISARRLANGGAAAPYSEAERAALAALL